MKNGVIPVHLSPDYAKWWGSYRASEVSYCHPNSRPL